MRKSCVGIQQVSRNVVAIIVKRNYCECGMVHLYYHLLSDCVTVMAILIKLLLVVEIGNISEIRNGCKLNVLESIVQIGVYHTCC